MPISCNGTCPGTIGTVMPGLAKPSWPIPRASTSDVASRATKWCHEPSEESSMGVLVMQRDSDPSRSTALTIGMPGGETLEWTLELERIGD